MAPTPGEAWSLVASRGSEAAAPGGRDAPPARAGAGRGAPPAKQASPSLSRVLDFAFTVAVMGFGVAIIHGVASATFLGLIDRGRLTLVLSFSCPLIIVAQFLSPASVVAKAVSEMDAQNLPTQVFKSQAACNVLGVSYAVQIHNHAVLASNMVGLSCQILYLACATYIRDEDGTRWSCWCLQMIVVLNGSLYVFILVSPIRILGHLITVFNVILFASPLTKVAQILRSRNASSLPIGMTCVGLLSNCVWSLYSMIIEDLVLFLPSILGFLLSSFQVLLILWCNEVLWFDLSYLLLLCPAADPVTADMELVVAGVAEEADEERGLLVRRMSSAMSPVSDYGRADTLGVTMTGWPVRDDGGVTIGGDDGGDAEETEEEAAAECSCGPGDNPDAPPAPGTDDGPRPAVIGRGNELLPLPAG